VDLERLKKMVKGKKNNDTNVVIADMYLRIKDGVLNQKIFGKNIPTKSVHMNP